MQAFFQYPPKTLEEKLLQLQAAKIIKRVGFYENVIILTEYFSSWSTKIDDKYVISTPWLKLTSGIKHYVFLQWSSVVMNTIFEKPGSSIAFVADKSEFITYRAVQDICIFLEKTKCITFQSVKMSAQDLFAEEGEEPKLCDFSPFFAPEEITVYPNINCLTRYAHVRKCFKQKFLQ